MNEEKLKRIRQADRDLRLYQASIGPQIPVQIARAWLTVAQNEGSTLTEIAAILGTNLSTASRQLLDLGERNRKKEPGYQLVTHVADQMNLRINRYYLTPKGRHLLDELAEA